MTRTHATLGVVSLLAIAAAVSLHALRAERSHLEDETARLRKAIPDVSGLRRENAALAAKAASVNLDRLRQDRAQADALRTEVAALRREVAAAAARPGQPAPVVVPAGEWTFAGNATPQAAFESVLWAGTRGDLDRLAGLVGLSGDARGRADALFQGLSDSDRERYGTPEKLLAMLLAASLPANLSAMEQRAAWQYADNANLTMNLRRSDGTSRERVFQFHRDGDGWRLLVPSWLVTDYAQTLAAPPPAPAR